jgi:hypothetical protein
VAGSAAHSVCVLAGHVCAVAVGAQWKLGHVLECCPACAEEPGPSESRVLGRAGGPMPQGAEHSGWDAG